MGAGLIVCLLNIYDGIPTIRKSSDRIDVAVSRNNLEWDVVIFFLGRLRSRLFSCVIFQLQYPVFFTRVALVKKSLVQVFNYFCFFIIT